MQAIPRIIGIVSRKSIPWELFYGPAIKVDHIPSEQDANIIVEHCYIASASISTGSCSALPFRDMHNARSFLEAADKTSIVEDDGDLMIYRAATVWNGIPELAIQTTTLLTDAWMDARASKAIDQWNLFAEQ